MPYTSSVMVVDPSGRGRDETSLAVGKTLKYLLMFPMSHITPERNSLGHDDRLDALAMLVAKFVGDVSMNVEEAVRKRKEGLIMEELRVFMGLGGPPTVRSGINKFKIPPSNTPLFFPVKGL